MFPYFFIFFLLVFLFYLEIFKVLNKQNIYFAFTVSLILILFAGLRHPGVGADDFSYIHSFLNVPNISRWLDSSYSYSYAKTYMEPGFIFFGSLLKYFTTDYFYWFFVISVVSVGTACFNYYKYSTFFYLSLLLFFSHTFLYRDINQVRSAIAAAIALFLIKQLHNKERFLPVFTILACGFFHSASICLFIIYFLSFFDITKKRLILMVLFGITLGSAGFTNILVKFLPNIGFITAKFTDYANYASSVRLFDVTNIKNLFLFFVLIFLWDRLVDKVPYFRVMMLFFAVATSWRICFSDLGIIAARTATFFSIVEVIIVPGIILAFRQKLFISFFIVLYAFLMLYMNLFLTEGRAPYHLLQLIS